MKLPIVGAPFAGYVSDRLIATRRKQRGGKWVPEDRLLGTLPAALLFVPLSVLFAGMCMQWVGGTTGLVLTLTCFFFNGFGVDLVLSPCASYGVDVLHSRSAEVMAANTYADISSQSDFYL